ncbi:MAG TPA: tyrosine-type recombinase/integrase [Parasegetibacter sp.]
MFSESLTKPIQAFLQYIRFEKRYSAHTVRSYSDDLSAFSLFLQNTYGKVEAGEIRSAMVRTWLASLKEGGQSARSIVRRISTLKSFFKYLLRSGEVKQTPMTGIVSPRVSKRLPAFVEEKAINTLLSHDFFGDDWQGRTEYLIVQLLYHTGMRRSELINLREDQLDTGNTQLKILGKGNKERIIPLSAELMKRLTEYSKGKREEFEAPDTEVLLVNKKGKKLSQHAVYDAVRRNLSLVTTMEKKSPHVLRHTFATHLANNGAELNAIKELLGHSSLASTQIYTHNSIEKLKDIHSKTHPKA